MSVTIDRQGQRVYFVGNTYSVKPRETRNNSAVPLGVREGTDKEVAR